MWRHQLTAPMTSPQRWELYKTPASKQWDFSSIWETGLFLSHVRVFCFFLLFFSAVVPADVPGRLRPWGIALTHSLIWGLLISDKISKTFSSNVSQKFEEILKRFTQMNDIKDLLSCLSNIWKDFLNAFTHMSDITMSPKYLIRYQRPSRQMSLKNSRKCILNTFTHMREIAMSLKYSIRY